ncbi:GNAT family N-acetyltransferase [Streptomyces seoulensis]|uniref:GNAT family N-acetyltransferase n=1 Tax=Streptomyces seoulensis TaxID=73044 RepID=A0A4P6TTF7_STRSO|nr:GNAT family N-acetyltransferase [Streptomyces seoulensis]QBJ90067.1 GNAT family N-acetyltransferase [Streptomyces seoulensis]
MSETWTVDLPGERVLLREPGPADEAALLKMFEECEDWFTARTGLPSAPGDVQSLYYALPEGADPGDKVLLLVERGGEVAGLVDAVRDWPEPGAVAVGLFLLAPWARGRGLGRAVAESLLARGAARVTATVPAGWRAGERFLGGLGFALGAPEGVLRRAEWRRGA